MLIGYKIPNSLTREMKTSVLSEQVINEELDRYVQMYK